MEYYTVIKNELGLYIIILVGSPWYTKGQTAQWYLEYKYPLGKDKQPMCTCAWLSMHRKNCRVTYQTLLHCFYQESETGICGREKTSLFLYTNIISMVTFIIKKPLSFKWQMLLNFLLKIIFRLCPRISIYSIWSGIPSISIVFLDTY